MPLPQVRRQLLDAILLPDISVGDHDSGAGVIKLDSSQQKAVDFNGRALLVEEGRGPVKRAPSSRASSVGLMTVSTHRGFLLDLL